MFIPKALVFCQSKNLAEMNSAFIKKKIKEKKILLWIGNKQKLKIRTHIFFIIIKIQKIQKKKMSMIGMVLSITFVGFIATAVLSTYINNTNSEDETNIWKSIQ